MGGYPKAIPVPEAVSYDPVAPPSRTASGHVGHPICQESRSRSVARPWTIAASCMPYSRFCAPGHPGGICRRSTAMGRISAAASAVGGTGRVGGPAGGNVRRAQLRVVGDRCPSCLGPFPFSCGGGGGRQSGEGAHPRGLNAKLPWATDAQPVRKVSTEGTAAEGTPAAALSEERKAEHREADRGSDRKAGLEAAEAPERVPVIPPRRNRKPSAPMTRTGTRGDTRSRTPFRLSSRGGGHPGGPASDFGPGPRPDPGLDAEGLPVVTTPPRAELQDHIRSTRYSPAPLRTFPLGCSRPKPPLPNTLPHPQIPGRRRAV